MANDARRRPTPAERKLAVHLEAYRARLQRSFVEGQRGELQPMAPAEIRGLMEAPAVEPPAGEDREGRIAMNTFRLLSAYDRGRQVGQALGELFLRRNPE